MRKGIALGIAAVTATAGGCVGGSSETAPASHAPATRVASGGPRSQAIGSAARARLLAEYRAGRVHNACPKGSRCPEPYPGVFLTGPTLLERLSRLNPSIPVARARDLGAGLRLSPRWVLVLPDASANRLDIATATAGGRYVRLLAVGRHRPELRVGAP